MDGGTFNRPAGIPALDINAAHKAWLQEPSPTNSDALLGYLKPTIRKAVTTYVGNTTSPTIHSRAKMMALDAAKSFDPKAGAALNTHIFSQLQGLKRYSGRESLMVSLPERLAIQKRQMERSLMDFRNEKGRDPSDDELVYHSGLPLKTISRIRKTPAVMNEGRFYQNLDESDGGLPAVEDDRRPADAWRDFIYHNAEERDKVIMEHTLGLNNKPVLDNTALAAKLRISPAAVSQRRNKLQKQLDEFHSLRPW